jgi:hypothetical protein
LGHPIGSIPCSLRVLHRHHISAAPHPIVSLIAPDLCRELGPRTSRRSPSPMRHRPPCYLNQSPPPKISPPCARVSNLSFLQSNASKHSPTLPGRLLVRSNRRRVAPRAGFAAAVDHASSVSAATFAPLPQLSNVSPLTPPFHAARANLRHRCPPECRRSLD